MRYKWCLLEKEFKHKNFTNTLEERFGRFLNAHFLYLIMLKYCHIETFCERLKNGKQDTNIAGSRPRPATLLKETPAQVFSYEYCEIFRNRFF